MLKKYAKALAILWSVTGFASLNYGATITFGGPLSGANEIPAVNTPATGFATVTLDTVTQMLTIDLTFSNLTTDTVAAHIHCCVSPGENVGVATTVPAFPGFPLNVTSGSYMGVLDLTLASSYNPAFVTAEGGTIPLAEAAFVAGFENEMTYLNIHTTQNPGGEIRAVLSPEPTSAALAGLALAGFWMMRRKVRR
ncbi:MAG TPA: CHRD domain-containing protein [Bryobacteraceae bacterium]|nr:CHRD domain-containing protein [Bryobacteraceae bacterium]